MRFRVGDLIHNKITQEQGRVVRLAEKHNALSYVVVVAANAHRAEKEALWRNSEIDDLDDETAKPKASSCESAAG